MGIGEKTKYRLVNYSGGRPNAFIIQKANAKIEYTAFNQFNDVAFGYNCCARHYYLA